METVQRYDIESTAQWADAVVVGTVLSDEASYGSGSHKAVVRTDVMLKGDSRTRPITFNRLGDECVGGPRLFEDEVVVLATAYEEWTSPDGSRQESWYLAPLTGKTLLREGEAWLVTVRGEWHHLGTAGEAILLWAKVSDASSGQTAAALAAVGVPNESRTGVYTLAFLGIGSVAALFLLDRLASRASASR